VKIPAVEVVELLAIAAPAELPDLDHLR